MTDEIPRPSEVRAMILAQHQTLRGLYAEMDALLLRVRAGDPEGERLLRERCRALHMSLLGHMSMEDAFLAPALRDSPGFGPVRADELLREHERQRRLLRYALASFDATTAAVALVQTIPPLLESLRADMAYEEQALLSPELLKDDPIEVDAFGG